MSNEKSGDRLLPRNGFSHLVLGGFWGTNICREFWGEDKFRRNVPMGLFLFWPLSTTGTWATCLAAQASPGCNLSSVGLFPKHTCRSLPQALGKPSNFHLFFLNFKGSLILLGFNGHDWEISGRGLSVDHLLTLSGFSKGWGEADVPRVQSPSTCVNIWIRSCMPGTQSWGGRGAETLPRGSLGSLVSSLTNTSSSTLC